MKCAEFGGETAKGKRCTRRAGWGTDASTGRCKYHRRNGRQPATEGDDVPDPPAHLSDQSQRTWRAVLNEWILSAEELLILQGALESWDTYRAARATVEEEGAVVDTDGGGVKRHPAALVARDALRDYRAGIRELGVSSEVKPDGAA